MFHRHLKKDRLKAESSRIEMDSKVAKKYDMKKYFKRAEVYLVSLFIVFERGNFLL